MNEVLVVGLAPSRKGKESMTLRRLREWLDIVGLQEYDFHNVIQSVLPYETSPKYEHVSVETLRYKANQRRKIVALGNFVSDVLERNGIPHHKIEHPSGLNRKLNDPVYVDAMLQNLRFYLEE